MRTGHLQVSLLMLVAAFSLSADARVVKPRSRSPHPRPPVQVLAIAEELGRVSGDAAYKADLMKEAVERLDGSKEKKKEDKKEKKKSPAPDEKKGLEDGFEEELARMRGDFSGATKRWSKEQRDAVAKWERELREMAKRWERDRADYIRHMDRYRQGLAPVAAMARTGGDSAMAPVALSDLPSSTWYLIDGALDLPVRDQQNRPTCAAFAGVRALEVLLRQNGFDDDLSEQYFYWASKPTCRETPCSNAGSWTAEGFSQSSRSDRPDIPVELACPYNPEPAPENDTQTPLAPTCSRSGVARVASFGEVADLKGIIGALHRQMPVVIGTRLSENFFDNRGLVDETTANAKPARDSQHTLGHAYVVVGYMKLPKAMEEREGSVCLLVANSWGAGWGRGGYGCITEKWFERHRLDVQGVIPTSLEVR